MPLSSVCSCTSSASSSQDGRTRCARWLPLCHTFDLSCRPLRCVRDLSHASVTPLRARMTLRHWTTKRARASTARAGAAFRAPPTGATGLVQRRDGDDQLDGHRGDPRVARDARRRHGPDRVARAGSSGVSPTAAAKPPPPTPASPLGAVCSRRGMGRDEDDVHLRLPARPPRKPAGLRLDRRGRGASRAHRRRRLLAGASSLGCSSRPPLPTHHPPLALPFRRTTLIARGGTPALARAPTMRGSDVGTVASQHDAGRRPPPHFASRCL